MASDENTMSIGNPRCVVCGISFGSCEEYRQHSKTDTHIANTEQQFRLASLGRLPIRLKNEPKECREPVKLPCDGLSETKSVVEPQPQEEEALEFYPEVCIFCCHTSSSFNENLAHMITCHGFVILSTKKLPLETITVVKYLWFMIFQSYECICCEKQHPTLESVQSHMRDKTHCCVMLTPEICGRIWWIEL